MTPFSWFCSNWAMPTMAKATCVAVGKNTLLTTAYDATDLARSAIYPNQPTLSAITADGTIPSNTIDPLSPTVINVSDDATVGTTFEFDCPVYLNDGTEYAFVLIANSVNYFLYTAKIGDTIVGSTNIVSTPPYLGNLFKSQNASTWVADPSQNLKFIINKAVFPVTVTDVHGNTNAGDVWFTNSSVQTDVLETLPFEMVDGSPLVRVIHKNHMMPPPNYYSSYVTLSNIATGSYNGVSDINLTGTFPITNVDLNSYTITLPNSAVASIPGQTNGVRTGPDGVVATRNIQFDSFCPLINQLTPSGTSVTWGAMFTTGCSVNTNLETASFQSSYIKDTGLTAIVINTTQDLSTPRMICSDINESTNLPPSQSKFDEKSLVFNALMTTNSANLSPVIDTTRASCVLINNLIDDPTFETYTQDPMDVGAAINSNLTLDSVSFTCQVVMSVVAVTGGQFLVSEQVKGAASGAYGVVVTWDGALLTLSSVVGTFQNNEAVQDQSSSVVGTCQSFQYLNTINSWTTASVASPPLIPGTMDMSAFVPGYAMTIGGCGGISGGTNNRDFSNAVTILAVNGQQIIVDTSIPFINQPGQTNITLTQYTRFVAESGPSGCTTASRYITRQFNLANPSNSMNILFDINRPPGAFVDVYYRVLAANSTQAFSTITWVPVEIDVTVDDTESTDPAQYKEYSYTASNIGSFIAFSIKIVMRGGNSSQVPKIQNFRAIALAN